MNLDFLDTLDSEEVREGAKFLDIVNPDWPTLIDTGTLRMQSNNDCIFGQLFGSDMYDAILHLDDWVWLRGHGFGVTGLTYWLEEINTRLGRN